MRALREAGPSLAALALLVCAAARGGGGAGGTAPIGADSTTGLSITVNVPARRLDVTDGDSTWSYAVAIGQPEYPTPIGRFRVREITWNPRWVPPPSDWARRERPRPPGPDNPMGRVKLRITGLVFIHGTPLERSLGSAASHACIRMANADAIAIARRVHRRALPTVPASAVDSALADSTRPRTFVVRDEVPVVVRYELAEVRRDTLWIHPDVYRTRVSARAQTLDALLDAGVDTTAIDHGVLARALVSGRARSTPTTLTALRGAGESR